jgi:hypothetical protein
MNPGLCIPVDLKRDTENACSAPWFILNQIKNIKVKGKVFPVLL